MTFSPKKRSTSKNSKKILNKNKEGGEEKGQIN